MVRQKAPVVKPVDYKRKASEPKTSKSSKVKNFDTILKSLRSTTHHEAEPEHLNDEDAEHNAVLAINEKPENMVDPDEVFDYDDAFELDMNPVEASKEFEDSTEEMVPSSIEDKISPIGIGDYVEQISDRVAGKLADLLLPSLDEIRSNVAKLVDLLNKPGKLSPNTNTQRPIPLKKHSENRGTSLNAKVKSAPLLSSSNPLLSSSLPAQEDQPLKSKPILSFEQSSMSSLGSTVADDSSAYPSIDKNLSYLKINSIYHKSHSIQNFATNLLLHLFDISELTQNVNVNGRVMNGKTAKLALDEKRINIIRQIIEEKAEYDELVWPACVNAMNKKISAIKKHKRK